MMSVETSTPPNTPIPIGPYSHIAKVGNFITIGGTAGVDPATGQLAGANAFAQAKQIIASLKVMLESAGSDLAHVVHVNVFLVDVADFDEMNRAYVEAMGEHRPGANRDWRRRASEAGVPPHDEPDRGDEGVRDRCEASRLRFSGRREGGISRAMVPTSTATTRPHPVP